MRILPINNTYTNKKTSFRSIYKTYELPNNLKMGLYTEMFRSDLDWDKLARLEVENFKNKDKVNIIQFVPSDGSEGYTQILSLLNTNPNEAEKFFPIQAYDINEKIVERAKSGFINLSKFELYEMLFRNINPCEFFYIKNKNLITNLQNKEFEYKDNDMFGILPSSRNSKIAGKTNSTYMTNKPSDTRYLQLQSFYANNYTKFDVANQSYCLCKTTEELSRRIQFNYGDMFKILPSIKDDSNTIILARNSLSYYKDKMDPFIQKAGEVLKKGSLFVVGALESPNAQKLFQKYNFEKVLTNVYRKN